MKHQTEWNLGLLYKNEKDPQIEKDIRQIETQCAGFEKKYRGKDFIHIKKLYGALREYEKTLEAIEDKPLRYFLLLKDKDSSNTYAAAQSTMLQQRLQKALNALLFFELGLAKIPPHEQNAILHDPTYSHFVYFLKKIFEHAKYNLSEKEEELIALLSQPGESMWYEKQKIYFQSQTLVFEGNLIPLTQAIEMIADLPTQKRRTLRRILNKKLKEISFFATAELNAIYNYKKIMDERRGYHAPYLATMLAYENDPEEIEVFINTVTAYFSLSKKFYSLHAKLLGEKNIFSADINASIGKLNTTFTFSEGVEIVKKGFQKFDPAYERLLEEYLTQGQIDVFPRKNKTGGGYAWGSGTQPNFVLLNYVDDIRSVETLAHEMGHSIHSELSKKKGALYRAYTISVAEVASTFFEHFAFEELMERLPEKQKTVLLHKKLQGEISSIFRQIACFNLEKELHEKIKLQGELSAEELAEATNKHMQSYLGKSVHLSKEDGYIFVYWSHLRYSFYVYSYAYGQLISRALYERWKSDPSFKEKIEQFLSAGNSMSPKDIFKSIGITTDKSFFEAGLQSLEADMRKLEKLAKKLKKI